MKRQNSGLTFVVLTFSMLLVAVTLIIAEGRGVSAETSLFNNQHYLPIIAHGQPNTTMTQDWRFDFAQPSYSGLSIPDSMAFQLIHNQFVIVGNDYTRELRGQIKNDLSAELQATLTQFPPPNWVGFFKYEDIIYNEFVARYNYHLLLDQPTFFTITSADDPNYSGGQNPSAVSRYSAPRNNMYDYHVAANRELNMGALGTLNSQIANYSYLTLPSSLQNGHTYTITQQDGRAVTITYDEDTTVSRAIKVNQSGYSTRVNRRYAYLGAFQPGFGGVNFDQWDGTTFDIVNAETGAVAHSGAINLITRNPVDKIRNREMVSAGEELYELDLSSLQQEGNFYIRIDGIGRSWPFIVGNDAIGRSFYQNLRGLFHQRGGYELTSSYTGWPRPKALEHAYVADYYSDVAYTRGEETGSDLPLTPFEALECHMGNLLNTDCNIDIFMPVDQYPAEAYFGNEAAVGGWFDAADFDRTWSHYNVIYDLTWAYEIAPQNFSDGQEFTPESNNGIPDILDEAVYGLQLWRNSQRADGGVSARLESWRHPEGFSLPSSRAQDDNLRYYFSAAGREHSLRYAAAAAHLSRLLRPFDTVAADGWLVSAEKAYTFGINPANHYERANYWGSGSSFREADTAVTMALMMAGLDMYLATDGLRPTSDREAYLSAGADAYRNVAMWPNNYHGWPYMERQTYAWAFHNDPAIPSDIHDHARQFYIDQGDEAEARTYGLTDDGKQQGYRSAVYADWGTAWGGATGMAQARFLIMAYGITADQKYLDAAAIAVDWVQGANPLGLSWTTGVGYNYPAVLQHAESEQDDIVDPVPGITVYGVIGRIKYSSAYIGGFTIGRDCHATQACVEGMQISTELLPDYIPTHADVPDPDDTINQFDPYIPNLPFWRRFIMDAHVDPAMNEFTVQESISPNILVLGVLMEPGWLPDATLTELRPRSEELVYGTWLTP